MTELEELTQTAASGLCIPQHLFDTFTETLKDAYQLGRASVNTPARVSAARANGAKNTNFRGGRKVGSKDKAPRKPGRWTHKTQETEMKP